MTLSAGHVFISHGTENRDEARALCAFIEGRGIRTWIAPRDVRPGQDYSEQLQSAIEGCTAFVVLVTEKANSSPYVRAETEMAFSGDKPIFPVRNADIQPGAGLAFFLKIRHWTDAFGADGDAAMERLGRELEALFGVERAAAPAPTAPPPAAPPPHSTTPVTAAVAAAPAWPPVPPQAPGAAPDDRLRAAIGPKADWYLDAWRKMDARTSTVSWNWPAFLATIFWFAYRKMWVPLVAGVFAILLLDFIAALTPTMVKPGWLILLALAIAAGAFGNHWYRRQVTRLAEETAAFEHPLALAQATSRGGTSTPALATALGIFALLVVAGAVAQSNQARSVAAATPVPVPSGQAAQASPPAATVPQPTPAPATPPDAGSVSFDSTYLLGRWTENGDCAAGASIFNADGTFISEGGTGTWIANGDRVTFTGTSSTITVQIVPIDQNTMTVIAPSGSARETRC